MYLPAVMQAHAAVRRPNQSHERKSVHNNAHSTIHSNTFNKNIFMLKCIKEEEAAAAAARN